MARTVNPQDKAGDMDDSYVQPPPDIYYCKIEDASFKDKKDSSGQYCNGKLRVLASASPESGDEFANAVIWDVLALTDAALWRISEASISAGNNNDWDVDSEAATKKQLEGRVCKVRTKWEEYEGEKRTKIAKYLKLSPEERAQFASQHNPGGGGGGGDNALPDGPMPSDPPLDYGPPPITDDNLPF